RRPAVPVPFRDRAGAAPLERDRGGAALPLRLRARTLQRPAPGARGDLDGGDRGRAGDGGDGARRMRSGAASALLLLVAAALAAQEVPKAPGAARPAKPEWEFSASSFVYIVPQDFDYGTGTLTADRGAFHMEGRYNYEALDTGSAWFGANFSFGKELTLDLT